MLAMDVWCFSKSTIRVDLEKHQTRLHYWGNSLCNFEESPLQLWVFLLCTKHNVLLNSVCIPLLKQNGAALTTLIAELTMFLVSIHHARKYITNMFDLHTVLSVAISCALMFAAGEFTRSYLVEYSFIVRIAVVIPICVFVYLLSLILTREPFVCGVVSEFRTKGFKK